LEEVTTQLSNRRRKPMNDDTVKNECSTGFQRAQAALDAAAPSQPPIRIGSRWRNKTHGFVFRMEPPERSDWIIMKESQFDGGFSWCGTKSELLQQWEEIEP
jgi:hypothetical protein